MQSLETVLGFSFLLQVEYTYIHKCVLANIFYIDEQKITFKCNTLSAHRKITEGMNSCCSNWYCIKVNADKVTFVE